MSSDFFYNFSNKIDEDESLKLNLDELYNKKQQQDLNVLNNLKPQRFLEYGKIKGKNLYLEVFKAPFYVNGKLSGVCGTGRDLTEYVEAYRKHNCGGCPQMHDIFKKYEFKEDNYE